MRADNGAEQASTSGGTVRPGEPAPAPPRFGDKHILSVGEAVQLIRSSVRRDPRLSSLWVFGEVSGFFRSGVGHIYFTLKSDESQLKCVLFAGSAVRSEPRDGMSVIVGASADLYAKKGELQLVVTALQPAGEGMLYKRYMELKKKLDAEGLFRDELKRKLPAYPSRVGVATSSEAAALQDVINVLTRRSPWVRVTVAHTPVQGHGAVAGIIGALDALYAVTDLDCVLLVRGGGSLEDLAAFNDEAVVRRVRESPVPLVTGVGHRTDVSLVDLASDMMAPTPSAAAEICSGDAEDVMEAVDIARRTMRHALSARVDGCEMGLQLAVEKIRRNSPAMRHMEESRRMDEARARIQTAIGGRLGPLELKLAQLSSRLRGMSPLRTLSRGYSVVKGPDGRPLTSVEMLSRGMDVEILMKDGGAGARIGEIRRKGGAGTDPGPKDES